MDSTLITLMGNDQKLKHSIYYQYTGVVLVDQQFPIPYSYQILNTIKQCNSIRYRILNTPRAIKKDELISIWNNVVSISKLDDLQNCLIVYCFQDTQNDISQLLNDLHTQMSYQINQQDITMLTQHQTLIDQIEYHKKQYKVQKLFSQIQINLMEIQKNRQLNSSNVKLRFDKRNQLNEIADQKCKFILTKWKEMIAKSKTQADFLKNTFLKQSISQIIEKLQVDFQSQVQRFDQFVNIRQILKERTKDFTDASKLKGLKQSCLKYCQNKKCMWLYQQQSSAKLEQLSQIKIVLDRFTTSQIDCPACQNKTININYNSIIQSVFEEFQQKLLNDITQTNQQDSKEILQNIIQIMFLSNEEKEKTKIFNIIQQNNPTDKPRQGNQFVQSSIINGKYRFHNPPLFDFIKDSENTITTFREYFCKNEIHFFVIFLRFERTDIMFQRITNIIKKIHNLDRKKMALIVNQCQCEQEQKLELETRLAFFGFKTIKFISNDTPTDICKTLFQTLEKVETQRFDFTNTIFEQENDSSDQQSLKQNLINMSRQIEAEQKNNLRSQLDQDKGYLEKLEMEIQMLEETLYKKKAEQRDLYYKYQQDSQKLNAWEKQTITFKF